MIDLREGRNENLKFRTDLRDRVIDDLSVTHQMFLSTKLLKKSLNRKSKLVQSMQVSLKAFKHRIAFATNLAANSQVWLLLIQNHTAIVSKLMLTAI